MTVLHIDKTAYWKNIEYCILVYHRQKKSYYNTGREKKAKQKQQDAIKKEAVECICSTD